MAPLSLQDLRRRLYVMAKADTTKRVCDLYGYVGARETLCAGYDLAKRNNGAPGIDGVTFEADFHDGSYGYRPQRSAQGAVARVAEAITKNKTRVSDLDLAAYFDTGRHDLLSGS